MNSGRRPLFRSWGDLDTNLQTRSVHPCDDRSEHTKSVDFSKTTWAALSTLGLGDSGLVPMLRSAKEWKTEEPRQLSANLPGATREACHASTNKWLWLGIQALSEALLDPSPSLLLRTDATQCPNPYFHTTWPRSVNSVWRHEKCPWLSSYNFATMPAQNKHELAYFDCSAKCVNPSCRLCVLGRNACQALRRSPVQCRRSWRSTESS